jgi:hypothetical protein
MIDENVLAPNTSTSLQTTLAADAHLAEGQVLPEKQTLNNAKSLIHRARTRRPPISKQKGRFWNQNKLEKEREHPGYASFNK